METLQTTLAPGQTLAHGRYAIQRPLSEGGMGTLYLATDHDAFERTVVVKVLRTAPNNDVKAFQMRFAQEGRTLAALSYPTIPQIFAYFQDGPHTCIVMAYIAGHDLEAQLTHVDEATGAIVPGKAYAKAHVVEWGIELCLMLEYLASRQPPVVHHDIKPANLVLSSGSGHLFLVDFGTAATTNGEQVDASYGTPGYAPPEQYRGQSEPRSDVYALAATLYHLLTDDDPAQHRFTFPHLTQLGAVGEALRSALATDVAARSSAAALRQELERLRINADSEWQPNAPMLVQANPYSPASVQIAARPGLPIAGIWSRSLTLVSVLVALICVIAVTLRFELGTERSDPIVGQSVPTFPTLASVGIQATGPAVRNTPQPTLHPKPAQGSALTSLTLGRGSTIWNMAWSPDGQTLASVENTGAIAFWRTSDGTLLHTIKGYGDWLGNVAWSPDSQMIASGSTGSSIKLRRATDGTLVRDLDGSSATVQSVAWSADGTIIASGSADGSVRLWRTSDGTLLRTLIGHSAEVQSVALSRDGQWLASGSRDTTIKIWRVRDGLLQRTLNGHRAAVLSVAWSPDSSTLASGSDDHTVMLWRASDGRPLQTLDDLQGAVFSVVWSPDGQLLASSGTNKTVRLWQVGSRQPPKTIAGVTQRTFSIAFTPDGHTLAAGGDGGTIQFWGMP